MPLAHAYQARYLAGGGFAGETEIVLWLDDRSYPVACGSGPSSVATLFEIVADVSNERGELTATHSFLTREHSTRLLLGGEPLPIEEGFGSIELGSFAVDLDRISSPQQVWVMPLISAEGRFSVGTTAVPIEDFCR